MALGIPDDLFWECTPPELDALIRAFGERESRREEAARQRAGLIAASIYNVTPRKPGYNRVFQPTDFWQQPDKGEVRIVSRTEMAQSLARWAEIHNRRIGAA